MARRNNRTRNRDRRGTGELVKAQGAPALPAGSATYTGAQVQAMLNAIAAAPQIPGGFNPLPRTDPQVAFGPGLPLTPAQIDPVRPDTKRPEPRFNEYPVSANLPGVTDKLVPWKVLRDAAGAGGIPRRCIEIRKADISTLEWTITITKDAVAKAQAAHPSMARADIEADLRKRLGPEIARCTTFWERPDPGQDEDWIDWITKLLEEHLVLDAIAIYPRYTYGRDLYALEILDGSTVKPLRDHRGGKPLPPNPAYQQILWGFPRGEYVADVDADGQIVNPYPADTLIYKRRNVRAETPYGYSAVEQCLEDLDVWLRRRAWIRAEYTDGAIPSGLLRNTAQSSWTPAQVLEYETALNDAWSGQTLERHRLRILPPGFELEAMPDVAERYRPEYDLFLLKQLANHFSTTIAELNFTDGGGLGSAGYHEGQSDIRERTATMPLYRWIQALITQISRRHLGMPGELEFRILGLEEEDEAAADAVAQSRVQWGRMTLNEDRDRVGAPRYPFPEADMPMLMTSRGVVFLEGASATAPPGETVTPVEAPPRTDADGDGIPDRQEAPDGSDDADSDDQDGKEGKEEAVKAEAASYRRWARRNPAGRRPFRCTVLTKADAPADMAADPRVVFAEPGGDDGPKGGSPARWPGWDRDLTTAHTWAPRIAQALAGAVDAHALAERWLAETMVKADEPDDQADDVDWAGDGASGDQDSDPWAVTAALTFLQRHHITVIPAMAFLRLVWLEGWAIGHHSAQAVLDGRARVTAWGWATGDTEAAGASLDPGVRAQFEQWAQQASTWAATIAGTRLKDLAQALAAGGTLAQIAARIKAVLGDQSRAEAVAVTEITRASAAAATAAYQAAGRTLLYWGAEQDEKTCDPCLENAGAGPLPMGAAWPTGVAFPPQHTRCRCWTYPA